ncbi:MULTISPECIES: NAD(P)-dependent oxidoreductase [unclassified Methylibium]|uniref:NAD(P)-dependent oxidoreductase n=1 Tax=unclassified Methylibium TaxID=2633235 RepID=UPI0003F3F71B|nr:MULTISPECIES: NAD(P)-dependent oxidoreductase [unclassified Methylibium]EWS54246.1 (S)-sulfolactate dehydrogenase [Methylibium sp. T29]EWS60332.1 (S)-sulfolactate dehydrogenase [Methylibium sp. T29-B]
MDLLIVEPIESEVLSWLQARHRVRYAPELARDARAFRQTLFNVRAAVLPPQLRIDSEALSFAPLLRAVARIEPGLENIDVDACSRAGVELVRGAAATAPAEAEFMIGALITLLRPGAGGGRVTTGRELASVTVGLVGLAPAARSLSAMLSGFGTRLVGYDPTLHASDILWGRWRIEAMGLRELLETADAVCVQLPYYSRYQGLFGERYLPQCKPGQVLVSTSHSALFDEASLAMALRSGRIASAWLDSVEPGLLDPGRPLNGAPNLHTTSRLAGYTQESRVRSVWAVAQRLDEILSQTPPLARELRVAVSPPHGPVSGPAPLSAQPDDLPVDGAVVVDDDDDLDPPPPPPLGKADEAQLSPSANAEPASDPASR